MATEPQQGDLYYLRTEEGYQVFKILKIDTRPVADHPPFIVQHVLVYKPLPNPPTPEDVPRLEVKLWHAPLPPEHQTPQEKRTYFANAPVTDPDLAGYRFYLEAMREAAVERAFAAYQRGCALQDEGEHRNAIGAYTEAIQILPGFVEALDNRGLIYLDFGMVEDAKRDFLESIRAEDSDDNPVPHLKLIDCYLMSEDRDSALSKIKECMLRWPDHPELQSEQ